ncbi:MAG: tRNA lysidine(34) synthetase TilS [Lachnospiraceae bacterium]|nr:tRNA lysidine(34) synthetase TilS [Lachnospiraceae bacterium]
MQKKILEYIRKHQMLLPRETCLVGLSGGADSVCLLFMLYKLRQELDCHIQAVHINHNIRGEEARQDALFCQNLCARLEIPCYEYSYQVELLAKEAHLGTEEMGRNLRREAYADCMRKHGAEKLALAHHQNDLAETFLFHLSRGTSLDGLDALRPVRDHIIRPLLGVRRCEIENWLRQNRISWCEDSTNILDDYSRNQIRHHVIPVMEEQINPQAVSHIAAVSEDIGEARAYLELQTERLRKSQVREGKSGIEISQECAGEPAVLVRRLLLGLIAALAGGRRDITREHVESVYRLFDMDTGKQVSLPGQIVARHTYTGITLSRSETDAKVVKENLREEQKIRLTELPIKGKQTVYWGDYTITMEKSEYQGKQIPEKTYTKWFDYDRINPNVVFRTRQRGDYLVINQAGGRRKLKDYLIDCKIPQKERDKLLLLAEGSRILWVVGYRIGESAKISQTTRNILQIQVDGGNTNE